MSVDIANGIDCAVVGEIKQTRPKMLLYKGCALVDVAELYASSGWPVHHEGRVGWEGARVECAAVVEKPPVLLRAVSEHAHVGQGVNRERVVQLPVDRPCR